MAGLVLADEGSVLLLDDLFSGSASEYFVRLFTSDVTLLPQTAYAGMVSVTGTALAYRGFQADRDGQGDPTLFYQAGILPASWQSALPSPSGHGAVKMYGDTPLVWLNGDNADVTVYGYYVFRSVSSANKKLAWSERLAAPQLLHTLDVFPLRVKFGLEPSS